MEGKKVPMAINCQNKSFPNTLFFCCLKVLQTLMSMDFVFFIEKENSKCGILEEFSCCFLLKYRLGKHLLLDERPFCFLRYISISNKKLIKQNAL